jgi:hypothetical protein
MIPRGEPRGRLVDGEDVAMVLLNISGRYRATSVYKHAIRLDMIRWHGSECALRAEACRKLPPTLSGPSLISFRSIDSPSYPAVCKAKLEMCWSYTCIPKYLETLRHPPLNLKKSF